MKTLLARTALSLLLAAAGAMSVPSPAMAADPDPTAAAQGAAVKWLSLVDGARYAQSWDEASAYFRGSITKPAWEAALKGARAPLGAVTRRSLKTAVAKTSLPGVPDGEYVVIEFETGFEHKAGAVETVTPMKEKDGSWKVSGYFVK